MIKILEQVFWIKLFNNKLVIAEINEYIKKSLTKQLFLYNALAIKQFDRYVRPSSSG